MTNLDKKFEAYKKKKISVKDKKVAKKKVDKKADESKADHVKKTDKKVDNPKEFYKKYNTEPSSGQKKSLLDLFKKKKSPEAEKVAATTNDIVEKYKIRKQEKKAADKLKKQSGKKSWNPFKSKTAVEPTQEPDTPDKEKADETISKETDSTEDVKSEKTKDSAKEVGTDKDAAKDKVTDETESKETDVKTAETKQVPDEETKTNEKPLSAEEAEPAKPVNAKDIAKLESELKTKFIVPHFKILFILTCFIRLLKSV